MIHTSLLQRHVLVFQVFHLGLAKNHQPKAPKSCNLTIKALAQSKSELKHPAQRGAEGEMETPSISSSFIYLAGCDGKRAAVENNDTSS